MLPEALSRKLFATHNGEEVARLVKRLTKLGRESPEPVIKILMEYARVGPIGHWRASMIPYILELLRADQAEYRGWFEELLKDPTMAYWSVDGLIKTAGRESYYTLVSLALASSNALEVRANAIKCLADHSGQTFTRDRPSDPGYWTEEQLPLDELQQWAEAGYPRGPGFAPPPRHPDLDAPRSELDRLAQALDAKLAKARAAHQHLANPTNWLTPASPEDLAAITSRWQLPEIYAEFLRKFSPLRVSIGRGFSVDLNLYGVTELVEAQDRYSYDLEYELALQLYRDQQLAKGQDPSLYDPPPEPPFPRHYLVIADMNGDPFVLDLSQIKGGDAPVLTAMHGMGEWDFTKVSAKFLTFLRRLTK